MADSHTVSETTGKSKRKKPQRKRQYANGNPSWFPKGTKPPSRKGKPNKFTKLIKDAVLEAGENAGDFLKRANLCGSDGFTGYFEWLSINHPAVFGTLVGRIYPSQVNVSVDDGRKPYKSLEEVRDAMLKRGLPVEPIMQAMCDLSERLSDGCENGDSQGHTG